LLHSFDRGTVQVHPLPLPVLFQVLFQVALVATLANLIELIVGLGLVWLVVLRGVGGVGIVGDEAINDG
jgi:hypothetical protein